MFATERNGGSGKSSCEKWRLALVIALTVSRGSAPPHQATASAPPRQDIDFEPARRQMVEEPIEARGVTDSRVLEAMLRVPRHEYVPLPLLLPMMHSPLPRRPVSPRGFADVSTRAWPRRRNRISHPSKTGRKFPR